MLDFQASQHLRDKKKKRKATVTGQNATDLDERILYTNLVNSTYLDKSIRDIHLQPGGSQDKLS